MSGLISSVFLLQTLSRGFHPSDEASVPAPSSKQYDIQDVEARSAAELPFRTSAEAFRRCAGDPLSSDHMFETAGKIAGRFNILDICPARDEIEQKANELSDGKFRRPVMMIAIDGAHAPAGPEPSPRKEWKEVKGFRTYPIDTDNIIHLISRHQVQNDKELGKALLTIKMRV